MENDVDIMIITESWLKKDELVIIGESTPLVMLFSVNLV